MTFPLPNRCCIPPPQIELPTQPICWDQCHRCYYLWLHLILHASRCKHVWTTHLFCVSLTHFNLQAHINSTKKKKLYQMWRVSAMWVLNMWCKKPIGVSCFFFCKICELSVLPGECKLVLTHFPSSVLTNLLLTSSTRPKSTLGRMSEETGWREWEECREKDENWKEKDGLLWRKMM